MASKRRISYQWQLFIPLVAGMWISIIAMALWQFNNSRQYKIAQIKEQLNIINARIIDAYEADEDLDIRPYLEFVYRYYESNPLYDRVRISIYEDNQLTKAYGEAIELSEEELSSEAGLTRTPGVKLPDELSVDEEYSEDQYFYYKKDVSADGRLVVCTVLPFDNDVKAAIMPGIRFFIAIFLVALVITVFTYFSTRYFGQNVRILRTVAERAATDPNFMPAMEFPHDELGDIARQIVHMYNERSQAMQRQRREHMVAMHAIEEKARAKRQLTNNINHELRTPIGVIKGYLDTIIENPDMDDATRTHFIVKAQEHANRLVSLIADVSAITRLEEGGDVISTEELDFHDIVYTMASEIEDSGVLGKMQFNYDVPLDCKITGNYNLLNGMLMNLARNAAAYSKGTICELLCTGVDDKFYYFVFWDNGIGVGEEHIPHLFERFYRVDSGRARKSGGTGLGLPIVQSTILAHGGDISVENRKSGGLAFRFKLPKVSRKKISR